MRKCWRLLFAASLLGLLAPVLPVGVALADDATVTGACSEADFNAALDDAQSNGGGTITFDCGAVTTIEFDGVKTIAAPNVVVIDGGGVMELSGQDLYQLFTVEEGATLELRGITLRDGLAENGGAVYNTGTLRIIGSELIGNRATDPDGGGGAVANIAPGTLTIIDTMLGANRAPNGAAIVNSGHMTMTGSTVRLNISSGTFAGGIANLGDATISSSTLSGNEAPLGGAILNFGTMTLSDSTLRGNGEGSLIGGGIYNLGDLTVTNSTLSSNHSQFGGAAVFSYGTGVVRLYSSTVAQNSTSSGLGAVDNSQGNTLILRQTIVADQREGADCYGTITSEGYNLDSDESCGLGATGDISGGNASLMPLQENGGPTQTHMPNLDSDTVDAGGANCPKTDQRGFYRPVGAACDIGAVELSMSTFVLCANKATGAVIGVPGGQCPGTMTTIDTVAQDGLTFCIKGLTGEVTYAPRGNCPPTTWKHVLPADGDLLSCVHGATGKLRWVSDLARCSPAERLNFILAADTA